MENKTFLRFYQITHLTKRLIVSICSIAEAKIFVKRSVFVILLFPAHQKQPKKLAFA
jgi:hypothetical protein